MKNSILKLTYHKKGLKMGRFLSLNVNPKYNDFCNTCHKDKKTICSECYAFYMINRYKRLSESTKFNALKLSEKYLLSSEVDQVVKEITHKRNLSGLRFNSLGELINDKHVVNLQSIAYNVKKINPEIPITLWTKRTKLLFSVVEKPFYKIIQSSLIKNKYVIPKDERISHTFNVYDNEVKMLRDIKTLNKKGLNTAICHGSCKDCMLCYNNNQERKIIFELTKRAQRKKDKVIL